MQNWYCLVNFPDETREVHLVPGPAPVYENAVVKIVGKPGQWHVLDITVRVKRVNDVAAEIWVTPATEVGLV